jgi:protein gp37
MKDTKISWTDDSFCPWIGCVKVSAGCKNCYADSLWGKFHGKGNWGPNSSRHITDTWDDPVKWNAKAAAARTLVGRGATASVDGLTEPQQRILETLATMQGPVSVEDLKTAAKSQVRTVEQLIGSGHLVVVGRRTVAELPRPRVFCSSMSDVFEDHPDANPLRPKLWELIRACPELDFQLLTKRPQNIRRFLPGDWGLGWPNVWLGTSIENMDVAHRADILRQIPATVRFISYEPALGPLDELDLKGIDWVIYGGESGSGFRPADPQWARDMRDKCALEGVTFFHKQISAFRSGQGEELDGVLHHDFPTPRFVQLGIPTPPLSTAEGGAGTVDGDGVAAGDAETAGAGAVDGDGVADAPEISSMAPPTDPSPSQAAAA